MVSNIPVGGTEVILSCYVESYLSVSITFRRVPRGMGTCKGASRLNSDITNIVNESNQ